MVCWVTAQVITLNQCCLSSMRPVGFSWGSFTAARYHSLQFENCILENTATSPRSQQVDVAYSNVRFHRIYVDEWYGWRCIDLSHYNDIVLCRKNTAILIPLSQGLIEQWNSMIPSQSAYEMFNKRHQSTVGFGPIWQKFHQTIPIKFWFDNKHFLYVNVSLN